MQSTPQSKAPEIHGPDDESQEQVHGLPRLKYLRRALRKQQTPAEIRLWQRLRNRQLAERKFKRQHSIGPYIVDFYCAKEHLAIELDGAVHQDVLRREYDDERTLFLCSQGIRVVRFENRQVFESLHVVLEAIAWHFDQDADAV